MDTSFDVVNQHPYRFGALKTGLCPDKNGK